ncbi:hypothetical protein D3C80_1119320 [compost metagenome]
MFQGLQGRHVQNFHGTPTERHDFQLAQVGDGPADGFKPQSKVRSNVFPGHAQDKALGRETTLDVAFGQAE